MNTTFALCLFFLPALGAATRPIQSAAEIGLENDTARILFHAKTGQLLTLWNVPLHDQYLKDRHDDGGPFAIYSDFRAGFDIGSQGTVMRTSADPAAIADSIATPLNSRLESASFQRSGAGLELSLVYRDTAARWRIGLRVWLPDAGGASEWRLSLTNLRPYAAVFMAGFPNIAGFRLGPDAASNLQTTLREGGGITPAWTKAGGIYGNGGQLAMQWHALFDRPAGVNFGLIVADPELRNKWFRIAKQKIEVLYFPPETLAPGATWNSPATRLIIGAGDWKPIARAYSKWFGDTFRMAARPAWVDGVDSWMGAWFAKKGGILPPGGCSATAHCLDSFRDLPENYLERPVDLHEYAFHTQGSSRDPSVHTDGDNILRDDLGGAPALKAGIARVHKLGYRFVFYVEGYIVHKSSDLAKSGKAERWSVMHQDGSITGSYTKAGFYQMCPGAAEWQDHLAEVSARLVRETGADGIRLDSLGFYFLTCYNPAHHHASPFGYNLWIQQLLEKVSRAVRAVNPDCVLATEAPADFYSQWFHTALHQTWTIGRELPPMRIALPGYRAFNYQAIGPIYGSLSGFPGGSNGYEGNPAVRSLDENWRAMRYGVAGTLLNGEVADRDPEPSLPDVTCRLFQGAGHAVAVCARVQETSAWNFPKDIRLAADRKPITVRLHDLPMPVESACLYNLETATTAPLNIRREHGDAVFDVDQTNWFMAVLSAPGGPRPAAISPIADLHPGESREVELTGAVPPKGATLSARGLEFSMPVMVPGKATLAIPSDTPPGRYELLLDGPGLLGMKRFFVVTPSK